MIEKLHISLGHLGCNRLQYGIFRRYYYWNNMTKDIKDFIHNFISKYLTYTSTNLNKSEVYKINKYYHYPKERVEIDLTYLS